MEPVTIPPALKALQLFALLLYFGGAAHVGRLLVAHRSAFAQWEPDRGILTKHFTAMARATTYWLCWPALIGSIGLGACIIILQPDLLRLPFLHVVFGYTALLLVHQFLTDRLRRRLAQGAPVWSAWQLRLWGHGVSLFLFAFIVLIIFRDRMDWAWGSLGLIVCGAVNMLVVSGLRSKQDAQPHA